MILNPLINPIYDHKSTETKINIPIIVFSNHTSNK